MQYFLLFSSKISRFVTAEVGVEKGISIKICSALSGQVSLLVWALQLSLYL